MGQHIGYARVSTTDQDLSLQINELKAAGCEPIFTDKVSGAKSHRPGLDDCLKTLRKGDTLVVWRLDQAWTLHATSGISGYGFESQGHRIPIFEGWRH